MYRAHRRFIGPGGFSSIWFILLKVIIGPHWMFRYPDEKVKGV
jgi:hypothetical protein